MSNNKKVNNKFEDTVNSISKGNYSLCIYVLLLVIGILIITGTYIVGINL